MMRVDFLPSDFDPMVLMLGEADDCRTLAAVLRQFARDGGDVSMSALKFCQVMGPDIVLTTADGPPGVEHDQGQRLLWRVPPRTAAAFARQLDDLAGSCRIAGSEYLQCGSPDGIAVKVSRGEYTADFLLGPAEVR